MELKTALKTKLFEINKVLKSKYLNNKEIGVLGGVSGVALFHFYFSELFKKKTNYDVGIEILNSITNRINQGYYNPTFCTGIAGFGWVIDHLVSRELIDLDADELLINFDEYLLSVMKEDMTLGKFDFLHAGIGYAVYFHQRFRNTKSESLKDNYKNYLLLFLNKLIDSGDVFEDRIGWKTKFDSQDHTYDLSLSHGASSIVCFLVKLSHIPDFKQSALDILRKAVDFIRFYKLNKTNTISIYPNSSMESEKKQKPTRLAWCYGDLGVALAFYKAGNSLNDKYLISESLFLVKNTLKRKSAISTGVIDADLCHGAFGIALMYNFFYQEFKDFEFKRASEYWCDFGLNLAGNDRDNAGFKHWSGDSEGWTSNLTILEGISGIGLSIISFIADEDFDWYECLLI